MNGTDRIDTPFANIPPPPCARLLGWQLEAHDAARGWVRIRFDGKADFLNPAGLVQGGLQTAMLDDCMGPAVWVKTGGELYTATMDLNVSFLAPAKLGLLFGEGEIVKLGRTVAFTEARLFDAEGALLARATATQRLLSARQALG